MIYQDRQKLEGLVRSNHLRSKKNKVTQKQLAEVLQCSEATLSRELKKGRVDLMNCTRRGQHINGRL
ncbi:MAG: hypothetical protein WAV55_02615 [Clostridiaceae bacterium]